MTPDSISPSQLDLLRSVAAMTDPYAAYGRSLLYLLTEEKIEPALPSNVHLRSVIKDYEVENESYAIYPNPASDYITIEITNYNLESRYTYEIISVYGVLLSKGLVHNQDIINLVKAPSGMYLINLYKNNLPVHVQKIMINE